MCVALHHWYFNPRLREGGDLVLWLPALCFAISIHASAREATEGDWFTTSNVLEFQSTPPRGRRPGVSERNCNKQRFQSTPPRGRRHLAIKMLVYLWRFQSTPPRGRRRIRKRIIRTQSFRFQSTPPRGRRPLIFVLSTNTGRFQSTPPRGRRPFVQTDVRRRSDFNPRLREGGDAP